MLTSRSTDSPHPNLPPCTVSPMRKRLFVSAVLPKVIALLFGVSLASLASAADSASLPTPRPDQWAQPIDPHYNLYRITPTLYRSRQPDVAAQPLLEKLGIHTVVNFIKDSDSAWLTDPSVRQVQIPLQTVHVDDADMLQSLRAIQTAQQHGPSRPTKRPGRTRRLIPAPSGRVLGGIHGSLPKPTAEASRKTV